MTKVLIIGGGPAGCMASIACKKYHPECDVSLIDSNDKLGTKLRLTGGGRCNVSANVTNDEIINHTPRNGRFLFSSLDQFGVKDVISFFNDHGLKLKEEDHHRLFPITNNASDVVKVLENEMKHLGVNILLNHKIVDIDLNKQIAITETKQISFDNIIIASGGISFSQTGSDGSILKMLEKIGQPITDLKPAEVALVSNETLIQSKALQGLSFSDVQVTSFVNNKKVKVVKNDLLITHFGLSGPAALQTSSYLRDAFENNNHVQIKIDFLPNISLESLQTSKDIQKELLILKCPKRLVQFLNDNYPLNHVAQLIKAFPLTIHNTRSFSTAFVTSGGISLKEVNPKTLKSKIFPNLSFCGEVLDVNSLTGGYNVTIALSTGFSAGKNCLD